MASGFNSSLAATTVSDVLNTTTVSDVLNTTTVSDVLNKTSTTFAQTSSISGEQSVTASNSSQWLTTTVLNATTTVVDNATKLLISSSTSPTTVSDVTISLVSTTDEPVQLLSLDRNAVIGIVAGICGGIPVLIILCCCLYACLSKSGRKADTKVEETPENTNVLMQKFCDVKDKTILQIKTIRTTIDTKKEEKRAKKTKNKAKKGLRNTSVEPDSSPQATVVSEFNVVDEVDTWPTTKEKKKNKKDKKSKKKSESDLVEGESLDENIFKKPKKEKKSNKKHKSKKTKQKLSPIVEMEDFP